VGADQSIAHQLHHVMTTSELLYLDVSRVIYLSYNTVTSHINSINELNFGR